MDIPLRITERSSTRLLIGILAVLILIHGLVAVAHLVFHTPLAVLTKLFDVDRESNIPTLYNTLLFFLAGLLFYLSGRSETGRARWPWYLMVVVMITLGIDEGSEIHEHLIMFTLRLLGDGEVRLGEMGFFFFAWIIPYTICALALLTVLMSWLLRLPGWLRGRFILAGGIFVLGAVVVESIGGRVVERMMVEGVPDTYPWLPCEAYPANNCFLYANPIYVGLYTLEETLEMLGLIICNSALIRFLGTRGSRVAMTFHASGSDQLRP